MVIVIMVKIDISKILIFKINHNIDSLIWSLIFFEVKLHYTGIKKMSHGLHHGWLL